MKTKTEQSFNPQTAASLFTAMKMSLIDMFIREEVLQFGEFELKSGRISPYFFNLGNIDNGGLLYDVANAYARTVSHMLQWENVEAEVLFGPAYKGIPLATSTAVALNNLTGYCRPYNLDFAFNRKEKKDHGEGGSTVGASIIGKRAIILDDVITAGTAIRETLHLFKQEHCKCTAIIVALDRQEKGVCTELSAVQQIEQELGIPVYSLVEFQDIIDYVKEDNLLQPMLDYRDKYGV